MHDDYIQLLSQPVVDKLAELHLFLHTSMPYYNSNTEPNYMYIHKITLNNSSQNYSVLFQNEYRKNHPNLNLFHGMEHS